MNPTHIAIDGTITGSFVQAGVVYGDVHVHSPKRPVAIPWQLAAPPSRFSNRNSELIALDRAALDASGSRIVALTGMGGVGKTALALHWLHRHRGRFPDGCLHAELTAPSGDPVAPGEILGQFLRALGVPPHEVPGALAERRGLYRSLTADRAVAVILDDAGSAAQVRDLLPSSPSCCVLVTSRHLLIGLLALGATRIHLDSFDEDCAIELLRQHLGTELVGVEIDAARAVAQLVGGLPLALSVAAAMTIARPDRTLTWTANNLTVTKSRVDALSTEDELRVRSTLDTSFGKLSHAAAQAYQALGVHQGTVFRPEMLATALSIPLSVAQNTIVDLANASLATRLHDEYFQLHSLVHAHARTVTEWEPQRSPAELRWRMLAWYTHTAHAAVHTVMPARPALAAPERDDVVILPPQIADQRFAITWLEINRSQLLGWAETAQQLGYWRTVLQLADALHGVCLLHKDYSAATEVHRIGLRAANALRDKDAEFEMRKRHARSLIRLDHVDEAQDEIDRMLESARDARNRRWEASALKTAGMLHASLGRADLAVLPLMAAWEILDDLGRPRAIGLILIDLADTMAQLGQLDTAMEYAQQAKQIIAELSEPDHVNAARAAISLGLICVHNARPDQAVKELRHAIAVLAKCGSPMDIAKAHAGLAELYASIGDYSTAQRHRANEDALRTGRASSTGRA